MAQLSQLLELLASQFRNMGIPEPIVHWGHPAMMAIVIFVMGSFVGLVGWRRRVITDTAVAMKSCTEHHKLAPWKFLFIAVGYTGGVLSLVMQNHPILESPHFWTGSIVLILLAINGVISAVGFGSNKPVMRTIHAYLGSMALCLLFPNTVLELKLGLAI
ncbi:DUF4079 domain-containing protein [Allocoleopsis sp.]|uniref:DUF4079 domain-containing protein n=1 Tax=Allocoleopsis sp. TaxID=3088169 RepID=UPI002FCFAE93